MAWFALVKDALKMIGKGALSILMLPLTFVKLLKNIAMLPITLLRKSFGILKWLALSPFKLLKQSFRALKYLAVMPFKLLDKAFIVLGSLAKRGFKLIGMLSSIGWKTITTTFKVGKIFLKATRFGLGQLWLMLTNPKKFLTNIASAAGKGIKAAGKLVGKGVKAGVKGYYNAQGKFIRGVASAAVGAPQK